MDDEIKFPLLDLSKIKSKIEVRPASVPSGYSKAEKEQGADMVDRRIKELKTQGVFISSGDDQNKGGYFFGNLSTFKKDEMTVSGGIVRGSRFDKIGPCEDACLYDARDESLGGTGYMGVADGVGGAKNGEFVSREILATLIGQYQKNKEKFSILINEILGQTESPQRENIQKIKSLLDEIIDSRTQGSTTWRDSLFLVKRPAQKKQIYDCISLADTDNIANDITLELIALHETLMDTQVEMIKEESLKKGKKEGQTTISVGKIIEVNGKKILIYGNAGDSQVLKVDKKGNIKVLTEDNSYLCYLVDRGVLTEAESNNPDHTFINSLDDNKLTTVRELQSAIVNSFGTGKHNYPCVGAAEVESGDTILFLTDGINDIKNLMDHLGELVVKIIKKHQDNPVEIVRAIILATQKMDTKGDDMGAVAAYIP
jgi:serine/threonine protein phosphatase PrpC